MMDQADEIPSFNFKEGDSHVFEDGNKLEVVRINLKDERRGGASVTYFTYQGPGIPQKLILPLASFIEFYGHLFE